MEKGLAYFFSAAQLPENIAAAVLGFQAYFISKGLGTAKKKKKGICLPTYFR
jgi:hypothetical protein